MSPRSASVNEELRRRSRERLLQAAVELVGERGYEATTLGDIADRAGSARGLVSYYFPGKRQLVQSAVHRLMHRTLEEALEREPRTDDGQERMARAIDAILGLAHDRPVLMRQHMAGLLQGEGFVQCPEQRRLSELLGETIAHYGSGTSAPTTRCCARCSWARSTRRSCRGPHADPGAAHRVVRPVRTGLGVGDSTGARRPARDGRHGSVPLLRDGRQIRLRTDARGLGRRPPDRALRRVTALFSAEHDEVSGIRRPAPAR